MKIKEIKTTNLILDLFRIRDIAHVIHLNTDSYSEHKALDSFYTGWLALSDKFIESYQGIQGKIPISFSDAIMININNSSSLMVEASKVVGFLKKKADAYSELLNILDEMQDLVNTTKYLLTLK